MQNSIAQQRQFNVMKTWLIMSVFFMLVMAIGWVISYVSGNASFLWIALFISLAMNVSAYWFSDTVAIKTSGAIPATKEDYPLLHELIEEISQKAGLPKPNIYIIDDEAPNAFATGRDPQHAAVAATTGILKILSKDELRGVMAHEMSHVGNRDILVMTVAVVLSGFVTMLAQMLISTGMRDNNNERGGVGVIVTVVAMIIAPVAAQLLQLAVSRKREFLADASGAEMTQEPQHLATALQKISSYDKPMEKANYATAHLFISNPFGSHPAGTYLARLFATHPPVAERVQILMDMRM